MKYLFVIQGEGRGHLTQALSMKQLLERNGHEVVAVMVGASHKRTLPSFFSKKINTEVIRFRSPNFMPRPAEKRPFLPASILYNLLLLPVYIESIINLKRTIDRKNPDVVINFYELICGISYGIFHQSAPMISMAHQYYFLTKDFKYRGKRKFAFALLNLFSRVTMWNADKTLALSFRPAEKHTNGRISIVPPLLRPEVLNEIPVKGNYIHGYMLNDGYVQEITKWSENSDEKLHFFWDKKNAARITTINDSLTMHTIDDRRFLSYLSSAKSYATTAGFESVCEALYLGKPVLMVPTHIEQECNAQDAVEAGAGVTADNFDIDALLHYLPTHKNDIRFNYWVKNANEIILAEITESQTQGRVVVIA